MKIVVAVDQNWGIGYQGELLQRIPEDMKSFKEMTMNHVVVMGRGTYDSLPGKAPLKNRVNIVLSKRLQDDRVIVCHTPEELLQELNKYDRDDLYVIGGESIYHILLPYCTEAYVTKIQNTYPADKFFANIDQDNTWRLVSESELKTYQGVHYTFTKYVKQN
jgi:dihydrofolate reductase